MMLICFADPGRHKSIQCGEPPVLIELVVSVHDSGDFAFRSLTCSNV